MAERTQRDAFWGRLYDLAVNDRDIVVISADMGAPALDAFRRDLDAQFINVGIAEQNAITLGAGLALEGKKVFTYAIAPFITLRCLEQIRVQAGIMNLPLTIVGVGAGFSYEESGPTHHLIEDLGIMRSMPHLTIHSITDSPMAEAFAVTCCREARPRYIRLDRQALPDIYSSRGDFSAGLSLLREGRDGLIIATGAMTHSALALAESIDGKGRSVGVMDVYTFPINETLFREEVGGHAKLVSIEEHFLPGGLGSAVAEVMADLKLPVTLRRLGLPPAKGYSYTYGGRELIRSRYGLDMARMERDILDHLEA